MLVERNAYICVERYACREGCMWRDMRVVIDACRRIERHTCGERFVWRKMRGVRDACTCAERDA